MEDIILVTGCHRTRSWLNVAFSENDTGTDSRVSFGVLLDGNDPDIRINWLISPGNIRGAVLSQGPDGKVCYCVNGENQEQNMMTLRLSEPTGGSMCIYTGVPRHSYPQDIAEASYSGG
jgi:hypothetical protein